MIRPHGPGFLLALVVVALGVSAPAAAETFAIDPAGSSLEWTGTKAIGGGHNGTVTVKSGTVTYTAGNPTAAEVVVDMTSIVDRDLSDPKWNAKLVGHLKSDDFFGSAAHPEAKLVLSKFKKAAAGYEASGSLTVKGVTQPVTVTAMESGAGDSRSVSATLVFDRTKFGIRFRSGSFFDGLGDKMISDEITIEAKLALEKS